MMSAEENRTPWPWRALAALTSLLAFALIERLSIAMAEAIPKGACGMAAMPSLVVALAGVPFIGAFVGAWFGRAELGFGIVVAIFVLWFILSALCES